MTTGYRHIASERAFQQAIIERAQYDGWTVRHFHDSRRSIGAGRLVGDSLAAGVPDLLLVRERVIWAEIKSATGRLSETQHRFIHLLRMAGAEVHIWKDRPGVWDHIDQTLRRNHGQS